MSTKDVAQGLVELCQQGKFDEATETYYSPDIVSIEPDGDPREVRGMEAIRGKMEWWNSTFDVKGSKVEGPWINEPMFAVRFEIDVVHKESGASQSMSEIAVYKVENGKITEERFF